MVDQETLPPHTLHVVQGSAWVSQHAVESSMLRVQFIGAMGK